jgi:parallel beta-helix repeat protein
VARIAAGSNGSTGKRARLRRALGASVAAVAYAALLVAPAAANVDCGDTITQDTKLKHDLRNCTGDGLVIDASDVTLDLNGHVVDGDGSGGGHGVVIAPSRQGVVVKNGKVRQFNDGVFVGQEGRGHRLLHLRLLDNRRIGLHLEGAIENSLVRSVESAGNDDHGFSVFLSTGIVFERATASGNGGRGFELAALDEGVVDESGARNNGDDGLFLDANSNGVLVRDFVADRNQDSGLLVSGSGHTLLRVRSVKTDGDGITLFASRYKLLDSFASNNAADGVFVIAFADEGLLRGNTANENEDDGFDVDSPDTTLRRNTANDNGNVGIDAVAGVTDLGGNRAKGNGGQDCVSVDC